MSLLIDTANLEEIKRALEVMPLDGVTTCPSIITREHRPFWDILSDIRSLIGDSMLLHAQVMGGTAEEIYKDAIALRKRVSGVFYVKVPVTIEGFKAMKMLNRDGIEFTATTIHSASQAIMAAELGASFLAPYINHIEDANESGAELVRQVVDYVSMHGLKAKLLAASFRNVRQIMDVLDAGAHYVTLAPDLFWKMAANAMTDASVQKFRNDWDKCYGSDKAIYNL